MVSRKGISKQAFRLLISIARIIEYIFDKCLHDQKLSNHTDILFLFLYDTYSNSLQSK